MAPWARQVRIEEQSHEQEEQDRALALRFRVGLVVFSELLIKPLLCTRGQILGRVMNKPG